MRTPSLLKYWIVSVVLLSMAPVTAADLQAELRTANRDLTEARKAFAPKLESFNEYQDAKKAVENASEQLSEAKKRKNVAAVRTAVLERSAAQAKLKEVAEQLEMNDPAVTAAANTVSEIKQQIAEAKAASTQAQTKKEQALAREKAEIIDRYNAIMASKAEPTAKPLKKVPLVGDETSIVLVEAKPREYLDMEMTLCGSAEVSDYYNFGYDNARKTHYAFDFNILNEDGRTLEYTYLYQSRMLGDDIVNVLSKVQEEGKRLLLRVKVTISSTYVRTFDEAQHMYELLDWQFYDNDASEWGPWYSETK